MKKYTFLMKKEDDLWGRDSFTFEAASYQEAEKLAISFMKHSHYNWIYLPYGGDGIRGKGEEGDVFVVKYEKKGREEEARFTDKKDAVKFYKQKITEKAFWIESAGPPELLDAWYWKKIN